VANLSKTLHINFYQNQLSIVEVMIKKFGVFFMPHSVVDLIHLFESFTFLFI